MLKLRAEKRTIFGKQLRAVRAGGWLPLVAYGRRDQPESLQVLARDFQKIWHQAGESTVIGLEVTGEDERPVLIHEVTHHPVTNEVVHADLYVIEKGQKLEVNVPLQFIGLPPAVKNLGGILIKVLHELAIEALPKDLPAYLEVDTTALETVESQILVKDIKIPAGVTVKNRPDEVVASIDVPKEEEETPAEPVDLTQIEVEKKGKKDEEEIPPLVEESKKE
ncbi:MAG: 50S ribosomal protein L25 [Patescibacteria group bacterium]